MWKLACEKGRQVWSFDKGCSADDDLRRELELARSEWESSSRITKHSSDVLLRLPKIHGKNLEKPKLNPGSSSASCLASESLSCARHGINYYQHIQEDDGHWAGDYGGPMFLMPGLVISCYISNTPFAEEEKREMMRWVPRLHSISKQLFLSF
jgi:cycloartenol synthase